MSSKADAKGFVIVTVVALLVTLLAFGALAIDVGMFYTARTAAQHAADAAALAGAFTFVNTPSATQPQTAIDHAKGVALGSKILDSSITPGDVNIQVDVPNQRVTVDIANTRRAYLAAVIGITSADIRVKAIAEASLTAVGTGCAKPWFIPNTILSTLGLCGAASACPGETIILPKSLGGGVNHAFVDSKIGVTQFRVKPSNPQNALVPGEFFAIRLGDSTGGNDYRQNIAGCPGQTVTCQQSYSVEPGNMIGPTNQGVLDLIGSPPDDLIGVDSNMQPLIMKPGATQPTTTSKSLVVAPIWDICAMGAFCDAQGKFQLPDSGANIQIPVVGFALIFLDGISGNDVLATLIGVFECGAVPPPDDHVTGPYSVPVRLVRTQ